MNTVATSPKKLTHYSLPYTAFLRDSQNLRKDVDDHIKDTGLLELIKADRGVRVPCFVLRERDPETGKRIIKDGSTRHRCLELLAQDPEYLEWVASGDASLELPFIYVAEDVAADERELAKFALSVNEINPQITTIEKWQGIKKLFDSYRAEFAEEYPEVADPDNLTEQDIKNIKYWEARRTTHAVNSTAKLIGKSIQYLHTFVRVFETKKHPRIIELIESGVIQSVTTADDILNCFKKLVKQGSDISIDDFITACYDTALRNAIAAGKEGEKYVLTMNTVNNTYKALCLPTGEAIAQTESIQAALSGVKLSETSEQELQTLENDVQKLELPDADSEGVVQLPQAIERPERQQSTTIPTQNKDQVSETKEREESNYSHDDGLFDKEAGVNQLLLLARKLAKLSEDDLWTLPEKGIIQAGKAASRISDALDAMQKTTTEAEQQTKETETSESKPEIQTEKERIETAEELLAAISPEVEQFETFEEVALSDEILQSAELTVNQLETQSEEENEDDVVFQDVEAV